jgi:hypothetical protein
MSPYLFSFAKVRYKLSQQVPTLAHSLSYHKSTAFLFVYQASTPVYAKFPLLYTNVDAYEHCSIC